MAAICKLWIDIVSVMTMILVFLVFGENER